MVGSQIGLEDFLEDGWEDWQEDGWEDWREDGWEDWREDGWEDLEKRSRRAQSFQFISLNSALLHTKELHIYKLHLNKQEHITFHRGAVMKR